MTYKFVYEVSIGDFVIVDLKTCQHVAVGKITGSYTKGSSDEHLRPVEWLKLDIDKSDLGEDVQGTLGTSGTISGVGFGDAVARVKQIVDTGKDPGPSSDSGEDTIVAPGDLPGQYDLMLPSLDALNDLGGNAKNQEWENKLANNLDIIDAIRNMLHINSNKTEFVFRAEWARTYLHNLGAISNPKLGQGFWMITAKGRWYLQNLTNENLVQLHKEWKGGYMEKDIVDDGCFMKLQQISNILERLRSKKNLILQGPPGTGKTWLAKRLAWALVGRKDASRVRAIQFHPNLSYEDFVRGWRPSSDGNLDLVDGPFLELVEAAHSDTQGKYVIVIEEINRGNPAQILGEMLTLLEVDKRNPDNALELTYKREGEQGIHLPPNLYVIGTMNIADRSLALVDLALRRRFAFVDLKPEIGERWQVWVKKRCGFDDSVLSDIQDRMSNLNEAIESDSKLGRQFQVGHSYVTPQPDRETNPGAWYRDVVESEIGPLLNEYWFDDSDKATQEKDNLLKGLDWL